MNLIIDIGNTRLKAALFKNKEWNETYFFENNAQLLNFAKKYKGEIKRAIICSVVKDTELIQKKLNNFFPTLMFSQKTKVPLKNLYKSKSTLGSDRLAVGLGANFIFPNINVLSIDAGTCLKYNFVNSKNEFIGGAISPGLQMRFNALHQFTAKLPKLKSNENRTTLVGQNTEDSIFSGVQNGMLAEIEHTIELYKKEFPKLKVLITGGDMEFLEKGLKKRTFAHPNLLLEGLNVILNANSRNEY